MLAQTLCFTLLGVEGAPVTVEAYVTGQGQMLFTIVGLPDAAVKESRDRVTAAVKNAGFQMPLGRTTVNLSPADIKKEGALFDLPIACAIIAATQQVKVLGLEDTLLMGELSLDGSLVPVKGVLPLVIAAKERGIEKVLLPVENAPEIKSISGMMVYPCRHLLDAVRHLSGQRPIPCQAQTGYVRAEEVFTPKVDLCRVVGQHAAKRALEVAAAGGHNMLMVGVPGSGKTMLARCLPGILPLLTEQEALETTRIHSAAGMLKTGEGLLHRRPFRTPHHTASAAALIGGGQDARPGEVSLAHNGVLFLDEMPEYPRRVLEALRQPLEDGVAHVSRVRAHTAYLSRCMLVASMNPCPCGYFGSKVRQCRCGSHEIRKYLDRVSGPLLDRIDIQVEVDAVPASELIRGKEEESSQTVRARVVKARQRQLARFRGTSIVCNAQMNSEQLDSLCHFSPEALTFLQSAMNRFGLSMRAYGRIKKVARTLADLRERDEVAVEDVAEAVQFRMIDAKYWGNGT